MHEGGIRVKTAIELGSSRHSRRAEVHEIAGTRRGEVLEEGFANELQREIDLGGMERDDGPEKSVFQDDQPRDPSELIGIFRHERHVMHQRRGCDPQVVASDEPAAGLQMSVKLSILPQDIRSPGKERERTAELFPHLFVRRRPTAGQFSSDGEWHEKLFADVLFQECLRSPGSRLLRLALHADDEVRIDGQAHGSSGDRSFFSASSTSSR